MANVGPGSWRDRAFRAGEQGVSGQSVADVLPAHDAEAISSSKVQHILGKLINRVGYEKKHPSLCWTSSPRRGPSEKQATLKASSKETRGLAKARQRSQSGSGATAFLRTRPVGSARTTPASEFVTAGKRFLGIEEFLAARCPRCGEAEVYTRHARLCHRSGAHVNQHQPLVHALSRTLKSMSIRHQAESGAPFHANGGLRMDVVIEAGGLRDVAASEYRDKSIFLDVTYMRTHKRGSTCGKAARIETDQLFLLPRRASATTTLVQDRCPSTSDKLATLAVVSFGRLGRERSDLIDQIAASIVGGADALSLARKDVCKKSLFQIISVTTQVVISRRVHRYRLVLRDRQAARGREEKAGGRSGRTTATGVGW